MSSELSLEMVELVERLAALSNKGPIAAVGKGATSVGMTLLDELGVQYSSTDKPKFKGIAINARRGTRLSDPNRVNLFARVPNWDESTYKSTREILYKFGYLKDGVRQLNCTVSSRKPNSQGLRFEVDRAARLLREFHVDCDGLREDVAIWRLSDLEEKLRANHSASVWVVALSSKLKGIEYFHFRYATLTQEPNISEFSRLLEIGTITVDHLMSERDGRVREKGPLFKIRPENVGALFPVLMRGDLLGMG